MASSFEEPRRPVVRDRLSSVGIRWEEDMLVIR
jgi:hypothetical protein